MARVVRLRERKGPLCRMLGNPVKKNDFADVAGITLFQHITTLNSYWLLLTVCTLTESSRVTSLSICSFRLESNSPLARLVNPV